MGLTIKKIAKVKNQPGRHFDADGLYLQIPEPGKIAPRAHRASWLLRFELNGRERWMGLGKLADFNLEEARERARKARQQLADGLDPLDARKAERAQQALEAAKAITFEEATEQYFNQHEKKWTNRTHREQFLSSLRRFAFPVLGKFPVAAIDTGLVLKVIEPIWPTKTETANRIRGRIEAILDWATVRNYRTGDNPARWRGYLDQVLPARSQLQKLVHHPALPYADVPAFMATLATREGIGARALAFLILCASRTNEIIGAVWDEIDFKPKTWTVPANRMKAGREHRLPLTDAAIELLHALPREKGNPHVFIGARKGGLSSMALSMTLRRMGRDNITVHGFRSAFRTWASECTSFPHEVCEQALAHHQPDAVVRAYARTDLFDKRRKLMEAWSKFATTQPAETSDNVTPLRRGQ